MARERSSGTGRGRHHEPPKLSGVAALPPGFILTVNILILAVLLMLAVAWQWEWKGFGHDKLPAVLWGVFPIVVPWAAALGGWLVSVKGVVGYWDRSNSPDPAIRDKQRLRWNAWHLIRVPMGMVLGTVGALLAVVFAGIVSTGAEGSLDATPLGLLTIALVAFVLGYRQESFDALVRRVLELITAKADRAVQAEQEDGEGEGFLSRAKPFWRADVNGSGKNSVVVSNRSDKAVSLGQNAITITGADKDAFKLGAAPDEVPAGTDALISVVFKPTREGEHKAAIAVKLGDETGKLTITGYGNKPED
jgi:hypothetical protein